MRYDIWKIETNTAFICDAGDDQLAADRRQEQQKKRVIAKVCVWFVQKRRLCTDSKDDICISHLESIEEAYNKDDICISHLESIEDAYSKDDICISRLVYMEEAYNNDDICIQRIENRETLRIKDFNIRKN